LDLLVLSIILLLLFLLFMLAYFREQRRNRQESVTSVAALLRAPDKGTRLYALNLLATYPLIEISVVEGPLWELMQDPDPEIRAVAGKLMGLLHPPEQLFRQLASSHLSEKLEAIEALAAIGSQKVYTALLEAAARAPEEAVRRAARAVLARAENTEALAFLIDTLSSPDEALRATAKDILRACGARALAAILASLHSPRKNQRAIAVELVGELGIREATEALVGALSDPVDEVRAKAAQALGRIGNPTTGTTAVLLRALTDSSSLVRDAAAVALAESGESHVLAALLEFLRHRQSSAHIGLPPAQLAQFLAHAFPAEPAVLEAWAALIADADENLLTYVATAMNAEAEGVKSEWLERYAGAHDELKRVLRAILIRLGQCGMRAPLQLAAHDHAPGKASLRAEAAQLMGEIVSADFAEDLFGLLSDPDARVRKAAAWAAGRVPHLAPIDGLCQALSDPEVEVRSEAARSLTMIAKLANTTAGMAPETVHQLVDQLGVGLLQAVNDPVTSVRAEVARALGFARLTAAVPALAAWALADESEEVRQAAAEALANLPAADTLPLLSEALSYQEPATRMRAAELLGKTASAEAVPHLIRSLQDEDAGVREQAGRALWEIGSAGMIDVLMVHLQSPDPKIRASIAGLVGKVRSEHALDGLVHALHDPNERVRAAVLNALAKYGPAANRHMTALLERLDDPDIYVRTRAARAILAVGEKDSASLEMLLRKLELTDPQILSEALEVALEMALTGATGPLASALTHPQGRTIAAEMLKTAQPDTLRTLLTRTRESKGEHQAILLGLLIETMKSIGTAGGYKQDLASLDVESRMAALEALSLLGTEEAARSAAEVLANDPAGEVRARAVLVLAKIAGEVAQTALRQAAQHDLDPEVKELARRHIRVATEPHRR
jgi:HEAT repeat protein